MPKVSVIIPNYNGAAFLEACLDSLAKQQGADAETIVVDNGSTDASRQIVESHVLEPRWIELDRNMGFAAAVNAGIRESVSPLIALLNNDAIADQRWLAAGIRALDIYPNADIVAGLMLKMGERDRVDSAGDLLGRDGRPRARGRGQRAAGYTDPVEIFSACAGAAFYRRSLFEEIGLFEESFFSYLEDVDLCFRARLMQKMVIFWPESVVYHIGAGTGLDDDASASSYDSAQRVEWIARNRVWLWTRNIPAGLFRLWLPYWLGGFVRSAGYHTLVSGQYRAFCRGLYQGLNGLAQALGQRSEIQSSRKASRSQIKQIMLCEARDL